MLKANYSTQIVDCLMGWPLNYPILKTFIINTDISTYVKCVIHNTLDSTVPRFCKPFRKIFSVECECQLPNFWLFVTGDIFHPVSRNNSSELLQIHRQFGLLNTMHVRFWYKNSSSSHQQLLLDHEYLHLAKTFRRNPWWRFFASRSW